MSRLADASVVHLAMHGDVPQDGKGQAALLFSNGRLDIGSIASLRLPSTDTVVVAACSSARGALLPEGTMSVARAFLAAGVPSVVATLWDIGDSDSAKFFLRLHVHLGRGLSGPEALRAAQIEAIQRRDPARVWAAMQSIGS
jgi:CHAT domain-containing protein